MLLGWLFPVLEEVAELADGLNLFIYSGGGGFLQGAGEEVKGVEEAICVSVGWFREVVMAELNGVGDKGRFFGGVDDLEAAVVLQGGADVEAVAGAEGPGGADERLVVDKYAASDGAEGGGVEVEGFIEVLPIGSDGGDGGLAEEVE